MKVSIDMYKNSGKLKNGNYPIRLIIATNGKQFRYSTPFNTSEKNWNSLTKEPKGTHPQFSVLHPYILEVKLKIYEISIKGITDVKRIKEIVLNSNSQRLDIVSFGYELAKEKSYSTQGMYETALNKFSKIYPSLDYEEFNYLALVTFKNKELESVLGITAHTYLKNLRSIYNEFCRRHNKENLHPFKGVFNGLRTKSSKSKKNYLERKQLIKFRELKLTGEKELARDLWMLQFYFGGQDLKDIVFLQKLDIHKGRASFRRKKMNNGNFLNNLIIPEAKEIINKYKGQKEVELFDWRKDEIGYKTFRTNIYRGLKNIQKQHKIKLPNGGKIGIKTARHTFANIGKQLFIEPDLLRELMGHERKNDIDTYYKDSYPNKVRDKFHKKIIKRAWKKTKKKKDGN